MSGDNAIKAVNLQPDDDFFINGCEKFTQEMQDFIVNKDEQMQKNIMTYDGRKLQLKTATNILDSSLSSDYKRQLTFDSNSAKSSKK